MKLTINISDEEKAILNKRAEKNFLSLKEQVEDILRRSCISTLKKSGLHKIKIDDKLVAIFSRERRGRKKVKRKKVRKKKK